MTKTETALSALRKENKGLRDAWHLACNTLKEQQQIIEKFVELRDFYSDIPEDECKSFASDLTQILTPKKSEGNSLE